MARRKKSDQAEAPQSLASSIRETPRLFDAKRAKTLLAGLHKDAEANLTAGLGGIFKSHPKTLGLLESIADGSPYLWELVRADPARLLALLEAEPGAHLAEIVERGGKAARAARNEAAVMQALRVLKSEVALLVALADMGGVWSLAEVTRALTAVADTAIGSAVDYLLGEAHAAGKIRLPNPAEPGEGSGFFVLGMGKLGAHELNYSSDIDLIVLYDPQAPLAGGLAPAPFFVRLAQSLVRILQERTPDGYIFRTDLRLRPDPGSTQVAVATDAALSYYENVGQTWERAAFIKARICAGDRAAGKAFLADLSPFIWRRYLDHAAIADVHDMKRQMHAFRGYEEVAVEGHNIKLGRGGIREIEFFAQTQQLIAGGRSPDLRSRETLVALSTLAESGWITAEARDELTAAYRFLRCVEHRLQMVADEQIHTLPEQAEALDRFAHFFGARGRDQFAAELTGHLIRVQGHYGRLFEGAPPLAIIEGKLIFPAETDDRETLDTLSRLGFRDALAASTIVREWLAGGRRSLRVEAARADLSAILPALIVELARTGNADTAVMACDRFFTALPGSVRLLAALRIHPDLIHLLATILGTAPRLGEIVAQSPSVLDGLLDPAFFGPPPDEAMLTHRLAATLQESVNEEDLLDRARRFGHEQMVLIGVRILSGAITANRAGETFATLADVLIRALHPSVEARFAEAHGRLHQSESAVIALGKLGGREMTAGSDLDLILLYDFDQDRPESDGQRPLHATQYYARLTHRLISALTIRTNAGKLYDVDLRLRPSGRSGPVATSIESFAIYQREQAWTWEHMALTRARVISASPAFRSRVEAEIRNAICLERDPVIAARDVVEMRKAIASEKSEDNRWNLKFSAGGLIDIEFIAQYLMLIYAVRHPEMLNTHTGRVLETAQALGIIGRADGEILRSAFTLYHDLTQVLRLCLTADLDPATAGPGLLVLLARAGGLPDFATLEAHLIETQAKVRRCFDRVFSITD